MIAPGAELNKGTILKKNNILLSILIFFILFKTIFSRHITIQSQNNTAGLIEQLKILSMDTSSKNTISTQYNDRSMRSYKIIIQLGRIKDKRAVNILINLLNDKDFLINIASIGALGEIGDSSAVEPLIVLLDSTKQSNDINKTNLIITALGKIGDKRAIKYIINSFNLLNEKKVIDFLKKMDTSAVSHLIIELKNNSMNIRKGAIKALGEIGDLRAVEPLIALLKYQDNQKEIIDLFEKFEIVNALTKIGKQGIPQLVNAIKKNDENIRKGVVEVLGRLKDKSTSPSLINLLKDKNKDVRIKTIFALGEIGDKAAIKPLVIILRDKKYSEESLESVKALDKLKWKPEKTYEKISFFLAYEKWDSLACIGTPAFKELIVLINSKNRYISGKACYALGELRDKRAVKPLITKAKYPDNYIRREAITALGKLGDPYAVNSIIPSLNDKYTRNQAIEALGRLGNKRIINLLIPFLTNWISNREASLALTRLGWKPVSMNDKIYYMVASRDAETLKKNWEEAKKILLKDMVSLKNLLAENAICALISIGNEEVTGELINLLNKKGTKDIAIIYLDSGEKNLMNTARTWFKKNKQSFLGSDVFTTRMAEWGNFKNSPNMSPFRKLMGFNTQDRQ